MAFQNPAIPIVSFVLHFYSSPKATPLSFSPILRSRICNRTYCLSNNAVSFPLKGSTYRTDSSDNPTVMTLISTRSIRQVRLYPSKGSTVSKTRIQMWQSPENESSTGNRKSVPYIKKSFLIRTPAPTSGLTLQIRSRARQRYDNNSRIRKEGFPTEFPRSQNLQTDNT